MKISFSTLACPEWTLPQVLAMATQARYNGVELRFIEGSADLWKLPVFSPSELPATRRAITEQGLAVACVDTSCYFHWPEAAKRRQSVEDGMRMADLAQALGAPGIRVFGDRVQPGADLPSTRGWIEEGIWALADKARKKDVEVWIETHGYFASSAETARVLKEVGVHGIGAVWDPANCFIEHGEQPADGGPKLGAAIRHVHIKDLHQTADGSWDPILTGTGTFPLGDVLATLEHLHYDRFVSFEWEKKWHPAIPEPTVALPQFAEWYRKTTRA